MAADPDVAKELGSAAAWFLGMMGTAIVALSTAVGLQWKHANKVYGFRLAERDTLKDALNNAANALAAATKAQEEQNRVTEELADAVRLMAGAFDRLTEKLKEQAEDAKERHRDIFIKIEDHSRVIASQAEATRNLDGTTRTIRDRLIKDGIL
jgi:hypothetical protein